MKRTVHVLSSRWCCWRRAPMWRTPTSAPRRVCRGGSFLAVFAAVLSAFVMFCPGRFAAWRAVFRRKPPRRRGSSGSWSSGSTAWTTGSPGDARGREAAAPGGAARQGCFRPLGSTLPPISPVAWSSFQTGVNPGKHNIFDFLTPDLRTYQPKLSSVEIRPPRRMLRLGKYRIPARQGRRAAAAQEQAVLERPERLRHLQLHPPRADHVPAGEAARRAALGDVRARPARHAGDVLALHDEPPRGGREDRRRGPSSSAKATRSAPT